MMNPLELAALSQVQGEELDTCSRTTKAVRLRPRAPRSLLAAEQKRSAPPMTPWVRETDQTARKWLKRDQAEGRAGLHNAPHPGAPHKVTPADEARCLEVVRLRPRRVGFPDSVWTWARLADYRAEQTGIRVEAQTGRCHLKAAAIALSRPPPPMSRPEPADHVKTSRLTTPARP